MSVFVIGEMASAHDGDLGKAMELVNVAVNAGCDAVKVQFWSDANRLADRRKVPLYYREIYKRYQIPVEWLRILKDYCGDRIEFMATCFLPEDVKTVSPFVKRFKVSAFENEANDLLRTILRYAAPKRQVIASMPSLNHEIFIKDHEPRANNAYRVLTKQSGYESASDHVLMYCESNYPTSLKQISLCEFSMALWEQETLRLGFSDHTGDLDMGAYAVCAGASYVEAHMKLINTDGLNPDGGSFAHLPQAFKQYVRNIRKAELVLCGDGSTSLVDKYRVVTV